MEHGETTLSMLQIQRRGFDFMKSNEDPKIHDRLLESIAPAIYGMEKEKEAVLLMLFGGVDKTLNERSLDDVYK